jgi:hypothetical protein
LKAKKADSVNRIGHRQSVFSEQNGQVGRAPELAGGAQPTPRQKVITPVMTTQQAARRKSRSRTFTDKSAVPTPVMIISGAVPVPNNPMTAAPCHGLPVPAASTRYAYTNPQGRKPVRMPAKNAFQIPGAVRNDENSPCAGQ